MIKKKVNKTYEKILDALNHVTKETAKTQSLLVFKP